jgi:mono/diheme cytochrome c family protein
LCHKADGSEPISDKHPWVTNDTCSACHKNSAKLKPFPQPAAAPENARAMPHPTAGLENCLLCHGDKAPKPFPKDHPWATVETCRSCHSLNLNPVALPKAEAVSIPLVPHSLNGLNNCFQCHTAKRNFPESHQNIANDLCLLCHKAATVSVSQSNPPAGPGVTHSIAGLPECTACHGSASGVPFPASHAGRSSNMCAICHKTGASSTTPEPTAEGNMNAEQLYNTNCASCHGVNRQGGFGPALTPATLATKSVSAINSDITNGTGGMSGYSGILNTSQIDVLTQFVKRAVIP